MNIQKRELRVSMMELALMKGHFTRIKSVDDTPRVAGTNKGVPIRPIKAD